MAGLSILLEAQKKSVNKTAQIINKITIIKSSLLPLSSSSPCYSSSPLPETSSFLDACFLCKQKLLPGKDIYMYKGDRAFCSVDCRCRQMFLDEENVMRKNCSLSAIKMKPTSSVSASRNHQRKGNKNRAGGFAY